LDKSALSILSGLPCIDESGRLGLNPEAEWVLIILIRDHFFASEFANDGALLDRAGREHTKFTLLTELARLTSSNSQAAFDLQMLVAVYAALGSMLASAVQTTPLGDGTALNCFQNSSLWQFVVDTFTVHV
jgi:hypothetical protein